MRKFRFLSVIFVACVLLAYSAAWLVRDDKDNSGGVYPSIALISETQPQHSYSPTDIVSVRMDDGGRIELKIPTSSFMPKMLFVDGGYILATGDGLKRLNSSFDGFEDIPVIAGEKGAQVRVYFGSFSDENSQAGIFYQRTSEMSDRVVIISRYGQVFVDFDYLTYGSYQLGSSVKFCEDESAVFLIEPAPWEYNDDLEDLSEYYGDRNIELFKVSYADGSVEKSELLVPNNAVYSPLLDINCDMSRISGPITKHRNAGEAYAMWLDVTNEGIEQSEQPNWEFGNVESGLDSFSIGTKRGIFTEQGKLAVYDSKDRSLRLVELFPELFVSSVNSVGSCIFVGHIGQKDRVTAFSLDGFRETFDVSDLHRVDAVSDSFLSKPALPLSLGFLPLLNDRSTVPTSCEETLLRAGWK